MVSVDPVGTEAGWKNVPFVRAVYQIILVESAG